MEKVITMYDVITSEIVGLVIVNEIELGYVEDKIIIYSISEIKQAIFNLLSTFKQKCVNTHNLNKKLLQFPKGAENIYNIMFLDSFELKSSNKNKSSRYKRMLEHMDLSNLERFDYYVNART